jgi:hypothetical protein
MVDLISPGLDRVSTSDLLGNVFSDGFRGEFFVLAEWPFAAFELNSECGPGSFL